MKQKARIIPSAQLEELKLNDLIGKKVIIIEPQYSEKKNTIIGYWVELDKPYLNESMWFIPSNALMFE